MMARLERPYIPISVRLQVAERQLRQRFPALADAIVIETPKGGRKRLDAALYYLFRDMFGQRKFALDHNPALVNRRRYVRHGKTFYDPPANDPDYLIYREAGPGSDHDIKTRVRGDGAQLSDLAIARKRKRKELKAKRKKYVSIYKSSVRAAIAPGSFQDMNKPNRWPKSRKIQSRGFR